MERSGGRTTHDRSRHSHPSLNCPSIAPLALGHARPHLVQDAASQLFNILRRRAANNTTQHTSSNDRISWAVNVELRAYIGNVIF